MNVRVKEKRRNLKERGQKLKRKRWRVVKLSDYHTAQRCKLFKRLLRADKADIEALVSMDRKSLEPHIPGKRRRGGPRNNWVDDTRWQFWERVKDLDRPEEVAESLWDLDEYVRETGLISKYI